MALVPAITQAIGLFNETLSLSGEDIEALRTSRWKLEALHRRDRSDPVPLLGLLRVDTMLADRAKANAHADELWGRRHAMQVDSRNALAGLLSGIAQFGRALEIVDDPAFRSDPKAIERRHSVASHAFLSTWDPSMYRPDVLEALEVFPCLKDRVAACGLGSAMQGRQRIVNDVLGPLQCDAFLSLGTDGDDQLSLTRFAYVGVDYSERRAVSDRLTESLIDFYDAVGADSFAADTLLGEVLLPVTARSAPASAISLAA